MILVVNTDNRVNTLAIATVDNLSLTIARHHNDTVNPLAVASSPLTAST